MTHSIPQGPDEPMDFWFDANDVGFSMDDEHQCHYDGTLTDAMVPICEGQWITAGDYEGLRVRAQVKKIKGHGVRIYLPYADRRRPSYRSDSL